MISNKKLMLLVSPLIIYICWYVVYPTLTVIISSFTGGETLFANYAEVLSDPAYMQSIKNALIYGIGISVLGISVSLIVAMMMYTLTSKRLSKYLQLATYTPYLLSWVIIFGIFNALFSPTGVVNIILEQLGVTEMPVQFWASSTFSRLSIIIMTVWKDVGYNALIFYVALLSIPSTLIEAVRLEKDTIFNLAFTVYLPQIKGIILTMFMLIFIGALKTFDSAIIVQNSITKFEVQTPAVYAYEMGVLKGNTEVANAASMIFMVICIVILLIVKKVGARYEND